MFRSIRLGKTFGDVAQEAFDTETDSRGDLLVLCNSKRATSRYPEFKEVIRFLWKESKQLNWFFNLRFDADAMFKLAFQTKVKHGIKDKVITLVYGKYLIECFDYKLLKITYRGLVKNFWDLARFLDGSLDSLAQKYLGEKKTGLEFDKNRMETYDFGAVVSYCIRDSYLTRKLAEFLNEKIELVSEQLTGKKKSPAQYYSKASLSEFYVCEVVDNSLLQPYRGLGKITIPLLRDAYRSFHGGMFQVFNKGLLTNTSTYDINSAYPYEIKNLLPLDGVWVRKEKEYDLSADFGIYHVNQRFLGFSPVRLHGTIIYPVTKKKYENYITKPELSYLIELGENVEVLDAWEHFRSSEFRPFESFINLLYEAKTESKKKHDLALYWLYKVIMNSLYGKFVQSRGDRAGRIFNPV